MITTTYTCDHCGAEQTTNEQFWTLEVLAMCGSNVPVSYGESSVAKMQVCRQCLEAFGIQAKQKPPAVPEPPTVEELIREIISRCTEVP